MHNVTLISTSHSEIGKCNADELYKIMASIKPEVIFEELPKKRFEAYYNGCLVNDKLEVKSIKMYLQSHEVKHLPVDIADPNRSSDEILMFEIFSKNTEYKKLKSEHNLLINQKGFDYLNSSKCIELVKKWILVEKRILELDKYKELLFDAYTLFYEDIEIRENAILQNIYNYSKENKYDKAIFLLGCGHRASIIEKIKAFENLSEIKLNWTIYGNE